MTELVIKIGWVETLGIIGTLITLAWAFSGRINKIENSIEWMKSELKDIKSDIKAIYAKLGNHDEDIVGIKIKMYGKPGSPMKLNESGKKLLKDSGFYESYEVIRKIIFPILDNYNTRTLYDAEKNSIKALQEVRDSPIFDDLKHYAVNHPDESLELIFSVASWIIRDDYAKARGIQK